MSAMEEAIQEFTSECEEMLERISVNLVNLEKDEKDAEALSSIYRDMHTIKGSSQLFGFNQIGSLAHALEACLDPLRKGFATVNADFIDCIYKSCDVINKLIESVKNDGQESDESEIIRTYVANLIELTLIPFSNHDLLVKTQPEEWQVNQGISEQNAKVALAPEQQSPPQELRQPTASMPQVKANPSNTEAAGTNQLRSNPPQPSPEETATEEASKRKIPNQPIRTEQKAEPSSAKPEVIDTPAANQKGMASPSANQANSNRAHSEVMDTIRVQVSLLDKLMNLTGELVLVRNQVLRYANANRDPSFQKISQQINLITSEIQDEVMKTRMQPIGNVLSKFHRIVRDLSRELRKDIELELEGAETELDKNLLEAVKDPLVHIIRNAADHGIETPEERLQAGKPKLGKIEIRAFHEGGQVIIEIKDNGRGLNLQKISERAIERGVITPGRLKQMSDRDICQLIFEPGFSTAEAVSSISGRGVGMDVVKTNIEKIGGIIELSSVSGQGTCMQLKIPLTLAIVPALLVRSQQSLFAIPQVKLVELIHIDPEMRKNQGQLEQLEGFPVYRLRGRLLPLLDLNCVLANQPQRTLDPVDFHKPCNIVVLRLGMIEFGLLVDQIQDSADIVVKPLAPFLKKLNIFAGATILGDGKIALTLDVHGLAAHIELNNANPPQLDTTSSAVSSGKTQEAMDYLVVEVSQNSQFCLPLAFVNRLEEIKISEIQHSGDQMLIPYRDGLLPLIDVGQSLNVEEAKKQVEKDSISVIVVQHNQALVGLIVCKILDVLSVTSKVDENAIKKEGILGTIIEKEKSYIVLDAHSIIAHQLPHLMRVVPKNHGHHILIVEDSDFFRKQVNRVLSGVGYRTTLCGDGQEALEEISKDPAKYSLVLTDIEMPRMDGFALIKNIRASEQLKSLPVVALTTRYRKPDIERGQELGFNEYLEKLNQDEILTVMDRLLNQSSK